jgi:hypothetical protein
LGKNNDCFKYHRCNAQWAVFNCFLSLVSKNMI